MKNFFVLFIITQASVLLGSDDYFRDDFDEDKNCKKEEKMKEIQKNQKENCAVITRGTDFTFFFDIFKYVFPNVLK